MKIRRKKEMENVKVKGRYGLESENMDFIEIFFKFFLFILEQIVEQFLYRYISSIFPCVSKFRVIW